jgi:hypothetical protein
MTLRFRGACPKLDASELRRTRVGAGGLEPFTRPAYSRVELLPRPKAGVALQLKSNKPFEEDRGKRIEITAEAQLVRPIVLGWI